MTLARAYAAYVDDPSGAIATLVETLARQEWWAESEWLRLYADGVREAIVTQPYSRHLGRRLWVGADQPTDATAGDIWFDVLELMPMMLLPSEPMGWREEEPLIVYRPLHGWLACRPVATWQYDGYRVLTGAIEPDEARDDGWARNVTRDEARAHARSMGKTLADHADWQAAVEFVSSKTLDDLWADQAGEWSGERSNYDDELAFVVTSDTFHVALDDALDAHELEDAPDPRGVTVFPLETRDPLFGFRTTVNLQIGLLDRRALMGPRAGAGG